MNAQVADILAAGIVVLISLAAIAYLPLQIFALRKLQRGWRLAALVPAVLMAIVVGWTIRTLQCQVGAGIWRTFHSCSSRL